MSTSGALVDTVLGVYEGNSLSTLKLVASNDDAPTGGTSSFVRFHALAGVPYSITVDTVGGAAGLIPLSIAAVADAPSVRALLSGQNIAVSWPLPLENFVLQGASNIFSGPWSIIKSTAVANGSEWLVKLPIKSGPEFFRLQSTSSP